MSPDYQISFSRFVDAQTQQNKKGIKKKQKNRQMGGPVKKEKIKKVFLLLRKMIAR